MCAVNIRLCKQEDLPDVLCLLNELSEVTSGSELIELDKLNEIFAEMAKYPEIYMNLVAEFSGNVVGFLSIIFYRTVFHKGGTALINELVINHNERGKGIGQRLVQRAKEEALVMGLDELEVGTEKSNQAAQQFYRKCGFDEEYVLMGMEFDEV